VICGRCASGCEVDDNFCRNCGLALRDQSLPAVREQRVPVARQSAVRALAIRGATTIAVGAFVQLVAARLARNALERITPAQRPTRLGVVPRRHPEAEDAGIESETFFMRRVRVRR
jgi:hypothetical protein